MATREELERRIIEAIDQHRNLILEVAETIRQNPEIAFQEHQASALLAASIQRFGYEVEKPIGGLETAFRASRHGRSDGPIIAVLAEYDALPGIGHGCGHNLIAASGLAAAIGLSAVMDEIPGIFEVIGCPAEEAGGGKVILQQAGVFDDVDAALMVHHAGHQTGVGTRYPEGTCLAVTELTFEYFGKPAHAAADPQNGINALNAVIKLFTGIDALRQHVPMETRIHGIITHGGDAPNIVPHYAAARFYVRAATLEDLERVLEKVRRVAEGAALMTGAEVKIEQGVTCYDVRPSYVIGRRYLERMRQVGMEIRWERTGRGMYSTDLGNISHRIPVATGSFAISTKPIPGHSQQVVEAAGSPFGQEQLLKVAKAMALTAFDLLTDPELLAQAKAEHAHWPPSG